MMTAEKIDFFKDSVNASYIAIPGGLPNTATHSNMDFMKTLEKSTSLGANEMSPIEKSQNDRAAFIDNSMTRKYEDGMDREIARERKEYSDRAKADGENNNKSTSEKSTEKRDESQVDQSQKNKADNQAEKKSDNKTDSKTDSKTDNKTDNNADSAAAESSESAKVRKGQGTEDRATVLKEILKDHRVQIQRIGEIKEDIKDNFSEAKAQNSTSAAEKLMLKKLGEEKEATPHVAKAKDPKGEESSGDKKMMKEVEAAQKDDAAALQKSEPKVEKTVKTTDNPAFNLTNDGTKTPQPTTPDAKISKIPTPQTLLEQYEGLKDKINQNVENSIKFLLANGENRINLKLYPPELGRVEVELTIKDNKISAKINTENVAVKEIIQSNLEQLKSNLQNAGTTIHRMDVEVGGFKNQFEQNFSNGASDGGGRRGKGGGGENGSSKDPNELSPGKIVNHKAQSYFLGRSINVII